jgi:pentatricopeptide repeat protein
MPPHADNDFVDLSGYTPNLDTIAELKQKLRLHHAALLPGAAWITDCPQLNDSRAAAADIGARVLQLSLVDLKEIEDAYAYFNGMSKAGCKGSE